MYIKNYIWIFQIIPTQNGEFAVFAANSKLYFLPANHTNCFYDIEVNSLDITHAKCIKIWCQNLPKCSAVVSILTREKIICYLFENDETIRFEQPSNGVENLTFTRSDYFYAWNSKKIYRYKISKNGLRIFRKIENLGKLILNLINVFQEILNQIIFSEKILKIKDAPWPGIEPGPPEWESGILTPRPSGTGIDIDKDLLLTLKLVI